MERGLIRGKKVGTWKEDEKEGAKKRKSIKKEMKEGKGNIVKLFEKEKGKEKERGKKGRKRKEKEKL